MHSELARNVMTEAYEKDLMRHAEQEARRDYWERESCKIDEKLKRVQADKAEKKRSEALRVNDYPKFENFSANGEEIFQSMLSQGKSRLSMIEEIERLKRHEAESRGQEEFFKAFEKFFEVWDKFVRQCEKASHDRQ